MGKLDQYFEQAKALEGERRDALLAFLESFFAPNDWKLSPEQKAELDRRLNKPDTEWFTLEDVEKNIGWKMTR